MTGNLQEFDQKTVVREEIRGGLEAPKADQKTACKDYPSYARKALLLLS